LKTKSFARWTRKERIHDVSLASAVDELRRGGYRTLLATNLRDRWVFLYGFAKNERR